MRDQLLEIPAHCRHAHDWFTDYDDETENLRRTVADALKKVEKSAEENGKLSERIRQLQTRFDFVYIWNLVTPKAHSHLLDSESFRNKFFQATEFPAFVISIDIRRSTELMLKARSSNHFANFLRDLCTDLMSTISDQYGVVDKFTGDGGRLVVPFPFRARCHGGT